MNIRNDDIADGNPKLTLGLIWTIILHFQVGGHPATTYLPLGFFGGHPMADWQALFLARVWPGRWCP